MALSNQPYLPLFVQDFLTDEKLNECSAEAVGVYIKIMCLMHKSKTYGMILLKQKYKQSDKQILDFATFFARTLPYTQDEIGRALSELIAEDVLQIEGEFIMQKRMIKDNELSEKRAKSGSKGGNSKSKDEPKQIKKFATAKSEANAEYEIDNETVAIPDNKKEEIKDEMLLIFKRWVDYKQARKEKYKTADSLNTAYEKLKKFSNDDIEVARKIINDAIGNNYAGFFEPKQIGHPPGEQPQSKAAAAVNSTLSFMERRHGKQPTNN